MILPKHVTKLTIEFDLIFQRWLFLQQYWNYCIAGEHDQLNYGIYVNQQQQIMIPRLVRI